jgi:thymidylate kinase
MGAVTFEFSGYDRPESCPSATGERLFDGAWANGTAAADGEPNAVLAGVIAVVGADGSGKTRLTTDLVASLSRNGPAVRRYMGLVSGETGDKIKRLPFVGIRLEQYLAAKARRAQNMKKRLPGAFSAIVMYLFSLWRVLQLHRLIRLSHSKTLVVVDRYPQSEIPGFDYDGPGLSATRTGSWLIRKLAKREQELYDWMAEQRPALVIRLKVDPDIAYARKSDHPIAELRDKTETMPRIHYNGALVREIDSHMPYPQVLEAALAAVYAATGRRMAEIGAEAELAPA